METLTFTRWEFINFLFALTTPINSMATFLQLNQSTNFCKRRCNVVAILTPEYWQEISKFVFLGFTSSFGLRLLSIISKNKILISLPFLALHSPLQDFHLDRTKSLDECYSQGDWKVAECLCMPTEHNQ